MLGYDPGRLSAEAALGHAGDDHFSGLWSAEVVTDRTAFKRRTSLANHVLVQGRAISSEVRAQLGLALSLARTAATGLAIAAQRCRSVRRALSRGDLVMA